MSRIRSIKPEFWSSPSLPPDPWARLLYIAMWNWADDNGVGTANPRELLGFAFPNDDALTLVDLRRMLVEIRRVFGVDFYTVAGRPYYAIPAWEKHQKFDRRSKGKNPGPELAETWLYQDEHSDSSESHESTSSARRDSVAGTGEQGNRGTEPPNPPEGGDEGDLALIDNTGPDPFEEFWKHYPRKDGSKKNARRSYAKALTKTSARHLIEAIEAFAADYRRRKGDDLGFFPHATTWLNGERWMDDVPAAPRPASAEDVLRAAWESGDVSRLQDLAPERFFVEWPDGLAESERDAERLRQARAWIDANRSVFAARLVA